MQNSMVIFNCSVFENKYSSWANLVQKIKICPFKQKFGTFEFSELNDDVYFFHF